MMYICGLSHFDPCLGRMTIGSIPFVVAKGHDFGLNKPTSRLEGVQNLCSLFKSLCRPNLD